MRPAQHPANPDGTGQSSLATPQTSHKRTGMAMKNTTMGYGLVTILLHWLVALVVVGLFALGLWMVELTYYDVWYKRAPDIHKSIGVLLFLAMLARITWRYFNVTPADEADLTRLERRLAHAAHRLLYILLFMVMISGYLISTADGRPIEVFGLFSVPSLLSDIPNQEDLAGRVHLILAISLVSLAGIHALAALKHHFIDHNRTLKKMLSPVRKPQP